MLLLLLLFSSTASGTVKVRRRKEEHNDREFERGFWIVLYPKFMVVRKCLDLCVSRYLSLSRKDYGMIG
jgi:hypothetical protein